MLKRVEAGEEIIIEDGGKRVARIVPYLEDRSLPTSTVISLFWKEFSSQFTEDDEAFLSPEYFLVSALSDALHKPLPAFSGYSGQVLFFFIDREPSANWGHDCLYVLYLAQERRFVQAKHILPPAEEVPLVQLSR